MKLNGCKNDNQHTLLPSSQGSSPQGDIRKGARRCGEDRLHHVRSCFHKHCQFIKCLSINLHFIIQSKSRKIMIMEMHFACPGLPLYHFLYKVEMIIGTGPSSFSPSLQVCRKIRWISGNKIVNKMINMVNLLLERCRTSIQITQSLLSTKHTTAMVKTSPPI